jgi:hypothetical protein
LFLPNQQIPQHTTQTLFLHCLLSLFLCSPTCTPFILLCFLFFIRSLRQMMIPLLPVPNSCCRLEHANNTAGALSDTFNFNTATTNTHTYSLYSSNAGLPKLIISSRPSSFGISSFLIICHFFQLGQTVIATRPLELMLKGYSIAKSNTQKGLFAESFCVENWVVFGTHSHQNGDQDFQAHLTRYSSIFFHFCTRHSF